LRATSEDEAHVLDYQVPPSHSSREIVWMKKMAVDAPGEKRGCPSFYDSKNLLPLGFSNFKVENPRTNPDNNALIQNEY